MATVLDVLQVIVFLPQVRLRRHGPQLLLALELVRGHVLLMRDVLLVLPPLLLQVLPGLTALLPQLRLRVLRPLSQLLDVLLELRIGGLAGAWTELNASTSY